VRIAATDAYTVTKSAQAAWRESVPESSIWLHAGKSQYDCVVPKNARLEPQAPADFSGGHHCGPGGDLVGRDKNGGPTAHEPEKSGRLSDDDITVTFTYFSEKTEELVN